MDVAASVIAPSWRSDCEVDQVQEWSGVLRQIHSRDIWVGETKILDKEDTEG